MNNIKFVTNNIVDNSNKIFAELFIMKFATSDFGVYIEGRLKLHISRQNKEIFNHKLNRIKALSFFSSDKTKEEE